LKRMDQIKSEFVSMVSHEIRSPLNSVLAQLKIILDGLAGEVSDRQQEILTRTSDKVKSLVTLSSELLDLARIESGLIRQEKEQLNLCDILEDQVAFHSAAARAKEITLELAPLPKLTPVFVDRRNMEEVFSNLITNAINYTPAGGKVTLSAATESDYLKASVADNGIGMAPDDLSHIFNRFYRIKNDKTRFIIGTGLGLAIVKSIVEAHNGFIRVESEPDHGSTFHVYIPCSGS
jgi:two-component system phosphate regulon sensor histidine kinase PhoR